MKPVYEAGPAAAATSIVKQRPVLRQSLPRIKDRLMDLARGHPDQRNPPVLFSPGKFVLREKDKNGFHNFFAHYAPFDWILAKDDSIQRSVYYRTH